MFKKILSGSLLIAGTTVGAGMLGIPLLTAKAGFWPAMGITVLAWAIMLCTGLLFMEATLWMPVGSNLLSMTRRFLGKRWRWFTGAMFLFLYYCLLVAYFAAGGPMLKGGLEQIFGFALSGVAGYSLFGILFAVIVGLGAKTIDRANIVLITGLVCSYILLIALGVPKVETEKFTTLDWPAAFFAMPILFSAFGYHNIIPSLCTYFKKDKRSLKLSIVIGTLIALVIYLIWQWLVIGIIPQEEMTAALLAGKPVTAALQHSTSNVWIFRMGQAFAFFAIVTSLLGVSFSMVDFLADGMKIDRYGWRRILLCFLTFFPPFVLVSIYPQIFDQALGIAGGIGEAILNGLIPIALVWVGFFHKGLKPTQMGWGMSRLALLFIACIIVLVMAIEIVNLV